ncbi:MAG TPA: type II toxin-antitoxin system Phd/YefM family antitoxin [Methylomirabilota bacterium]|nr:type II toxin-antitoxin system Phd/YefM family antitoxin [Methylomirabilota bacterium]
MARRSRRVGLAEVKDDLSRFLRLAESEDIVITRHGKPAGVLIGFESEDDWFDYRLEHHPEFLQRVAEARAAFRAGRGARLDDLPS